MSDIVKWALLAAALAAIIALIVVLPFNDFLDLGELSASISNVVTIAGNAFSFGRGLINNLLLPFGHFNPPTPRGVGLIGTSGLV